MSRQLTAVVFASACVIVGLIWDISWHMSIGRDTFWTPAHLAIYTGGAVAGLACGFEVLRRSFFARSDAAGRDDVTLFGVFRGPLGGWVCIWGAAAMLTSAPFDDWWHNAYGLDVKIISPPHAVLALGFWGILIGALMMAIAAQNRRAVPGAAAGDAQNDAPRASREDATLAHTAGHAWPVAFMSGVVLTLIAIFTYEYQDRVLMHHSMLYRVVALAMPFALVSAACAVRLRWPATTTAGIYMLVMALQVWILPLFAATPKLGPIRQPVEHMVSLDFPLLLVVPAFVVDLLMQRTRATTPWVRAALVGTGFLVAFAAVQWPFAAFLMSESSMNAIFRTDRFPYWVPMTWEGPQRRFLQEAVGDRAIGFVVATVLAVLSTRLGLAWGGWLRTVRR